MIAESQLGGAHSFAALYLHCVLKKLVKGMSKLATVVLFLSRLWDFYKELGARYKSGRTYYPPVSYPFLRLQTETCLPCWLAQRKTLENKQRDEQ